MKTTIYIALTALLLALPLASHTVYAQDEGTSIDAIVARMPAETMGEFNAMMQELSADGKRTVETLAAMLVPATEGQNSKVEYALNGLVAYVSAEGRETLAKDVRDGLRNSIDACTDKVNKAFLMTLLQLIGTEYDAPIYVKYLGDEYLKPFAISGLTAIEPDGETVQKLLEIQTLMASENSHERAHGLYLLLQSGEVSPQEAVLEALKDDDREYRAAALRGAEDFADANFHSKVAALMPELGDEAKADVVRWFGDNHVVSQTGVVVEATSAENPELAKSAIKAAGKLGGDEALKALASCMEGPHGEEAVTALTSFKEDVTEVVMTALDGTDKVPALRLAGARHVTKATPKVFELTAAEDKATAEAAYKALSGVCTSDDFDKLCALLDGCGEENTPAVRAAIVMAVQGLSDDKVATLKEEAFAGSETAFFALLNVRKNLTADFLSLAESKEDWRDASLVRMTGLMDEFTPEKERAAMLVKGLALQPSSKVRNTLLTTLGDSHDPAGIEIALGYIDVPEAAEASAYAIKAIVAKNAELLSEEDIKSALVKARDVYSTIAATNPDAAYAIDEINGLLSK